MTSEMQTAPAGNQGGGDIDAATLSSVDYTPSVGTGQEAAAQELLAHLHRGGAWAYWWTNPGKRSVWWEVGDPAPVPQGAVNVYFGVHPTNKAKDTNHRATIGDVAAIGCLFAEMDAKDFAGGKTDALDHVLALDPPPSAVADSGGGYHCYWLLAEPYALTTDTKRDRARSIQARWVGLMGGDPGAKDLARVLRVPGTRNLKYDDRPEVTVILANYARLYDLDALEALLPEETPAPSPKRDKGDGRSSWGEAALANELAELARSPDGERNDRLNRAAFALGQIVGAGHLDQAEVERALTATARGIGLGERETLATVRSGIDAGMADPRGPKDETPPTRRQTHRPIGARLPGYQAERVRTLAPDPPDPKFRKGILAKLRELAADGQRRLPADIRRENAGALLLQWLAEKGGFVQSPAGDRFYFYLPERRLYNLESDRWAAWLYAATGANPASTDYAHLLADCKAAAMYAPTLDVVQVAAWDNEAQVLRVSRFDGTVYVLDGEAIREEANGEAVLFDDDPAWLPYVPDFDNPGRLHWQTTELPNWPEAQGAMYGLALRAWELTTFLTELCPTRPMAVKLGEKGAGKTLTWRLFLRFLFGPLAEVSGTPDKPDGFTAAAAAAHVLVLDNLDDFRGWLRDKLARLSTGAVDEYRRLYTSNEVGRVRYRCWLAFTSRTPDTLRRDDLADRLLLLPVERIEPDQLQAERDLLAEATTQRGAWWGDVLTALNKVVGAIRRGELRSTSTLRMADWESVGRLVAQVEGATETWDGFIDQLTGAQADFLLQDDLLVEGLALWMDQKDAAGNPANYGREVTSKTLHQELTGLLFEDRKPPSDWPRSTVGFGKRLASIRRELRSLWRVEWGRGTTAKTRARNVYQFWPKDGGQQELMPTDPPGEEIPL
jgi:hypothetical protein